MLLARGLAVGLPVGGAADLKVKPKDPKQLAKEAAEQFLKAAKAKNLDGLMKIADVPWYSDGVVVKDRDELKQGLEFSLRGTRPPPSEVIRITTYGEIRELLKKDRREPADEVLVKDDLAVFVGQKGKPMGVLFVRVRDGKAKVTGTAE